MSSTPSATPSARPPRVATRATSRRVVWLRQKAAVEWHEQTLKVQGSGNQVGVGGQAVEMDVPALFPEPLAIACSSLGYERAVVRCRYWGEQGIGENGGSRRRGG